MKKKHLCFTVTLFYSNRYAIGNWRFRFCSLCKLYLFIPITRYEVREMHIFRSALSCCVIRDLPHEVIQKYCVSREFNSIGRDGRRSSAVSTSNFYQNADDENTDSTAVDDQDDEEGSENPDNNNSDDIDDIVDHID